MRLKFDLDWTGLCNNSQSTCLLTLEGDRKSVKKKKCTLDSSREATQNNLKRQPCEKCAFMISLPLHSPVSTKIQLV